MHPEEIKAALRMAGWTQASLADELRVTPSTVSSIVTGKAQSDHIQRRIAAIIKKPVKAIWPHQKRLRRSSRELREARARRGAAQQTA